MCARRFCIRPPRKNRRYTPRAPPETDRGPVYRFTLHHVVVPETPDEMFSTIHEEVKFDRSQVTSVDWSSYPILGFSGVPKLEIDLIDRPNEPPLGAGEASCAAVGAALGNAVFDATGVRLRTVPFTPDRVKAALNGKAS